MTLPAARRTAGARDPNEVLRDPLYEGADVGFRVLVELEPGLGLAALGALAALCRRS